MDTRLKYQIVEVTDSISNEVWTAFYDNVRFETLQPTVIHNDLSTLSAQKYEPLPNKGRIEQGKFYSYNGKVVLCIQSHDRTIYPPEQTPNLFSFYRTNADNLEWIVGEKVDVGWKRVYNGKTYQCLQAHMTQVDWTPTATLGLLWSVVATTSEWAIGVAYKVNDIVTYQTKTYKCLQAHTSISTWNPVATINVLWKLQT